MNYGKITLPEGVNIRFSVFKSKGTDEYNLVITPAKGEPAAVQYDQIEAAIREFVILRQLRHPLVVFQRFFVSDVSNQASIMRQSGSAGTASSLSVIQQPPAMGNKLLAWVYLIENHSEAYDAREFNGSFSFGHNGYIHLYTSGMTSSRESTSYLQSLDIFNGYTELLGEKGMTLETNCIRTWLFVRDIDNNYGGMVKARNEIFEAEGLQHTTHYIASTGIEGQTEKTHCLVAMDAYALSGIVPEQIRFLKASSHLSPTHNYGVAFERGTAVEYGDRRHIFISGTASIDHNGDILHENDIEKQTERTFENIGVLLAEAGASMKDIGSMIIYLRDPADTAFITNFLKTRNHGIPVVVAIAPVCRHGWLVEAECTAVVEANNSAFGDF